MSMLNWDEYYKQLLAGMGEIGKISPDVVRGYRTLGGAASNISRSISASLLACLPSGV